MGSPDQDPILPWETEPVLVKTGYYLLSHQDGRGWRVIRPLSTEQRGVKAYLDAMGVGDAQALIHYQRGKEVRILRDSRTI